MLEKSLLGSQQVEEESFHAGEQESSALDILGQLKLLWDCWKNGSSFNQLLAR